MLFSIFTKGTTNGLALSNAKWRVETFKNHATLGYHSYQNLLGSNQHFIIFYVRVTMNFFGSFKLEKDDDDNDIILQIVRLFIYSCLFLNHKYHQIFHTCNSIVQSLS